MLLSIGMIVKNEEKYLDKCLNSLQPILQNIDSELIIVDTGSTDNTVNIAKKYTSNVYHFEWCNDFAKARNLTLRHSSGKWFMYIDADEILYDSKELISFFNSNLSDNYNTAIYKIYNLYDKKNKNDYDISLPTRIFKINNNTKFYGSIHEYINVVNPIKLLENTIFYHYGYISNSKESKEKKIYRNLELLNNELSKYDNPRLRLMLCDCYLGLNDQKKALINLDKAIELAKESNLHDYTFVSIVKKISVYFKNKKYDAVIELSNEYLTSKNIEKTYDLDIFYMMCISYYEIGSHSECINYYKKYIYMLQLYENKKLDMSESILYPVNYTTSYHKNLILYYYLISNCIFKKPIKSNNQVLDIDILNDEKFIELNTLYQLYCMKNRNYYNAIMELYANIQEDKYFIVNKTIENFLLKYESAFNKIVEGFYLCYKNNKVILDTNPYILLMLIRYNDLHNQDNIILYLNKFLNQNIDFKYYYFDIIYYILKNNLTIDKIAELVDIDDINFFIESMYKLHNDFLDVIYSSEYNLNTIKSCIVVKELIYFALTHIQSNEQEKCMQLYENYVTIVDEIFSYKYNSNFINENNADLLNSKEKLDAYLLLSYRSLIGDKISSSISFLKKIISIDKSMINIVSIISQNISKSSSTVNEFYLLSQQFKKNILYLIDEHDYKNASNMLTEYKKLNPNDNDIIKLEKLCNKKRA